MANGIVKCVDKKPSDDRLTIGERYRVLSSHTIEGDKYLVIQLEVGGPEFTRLAYWFE